MVRRPVAVALLVVGLAACGGIGAASSFTSEGPAAGGVGGADDSDGGASPSGNGLATVDAGAANTSPVPSLDRCYAKQSGTCHPQLTNQAGDGGTATEECTSLVDAAPATEYACHLLVEDAGVQPTCLREGDSTGSCVAQASCKAGYECIGGETPSGSCRRYCCDPTACDSMSFCDVQPIVHTSSVMVPVCMPISPCELLAPSACPGQTCGIVDQTKGITSCVDIGPRSEGEECETAHCAKNLVCLGTIGARKCAKLCDTTGTNAAFQCDPGMRCLSNGVVFKGADVGVCGQ